MKNVRALGFLYRSFDGCNKLYPVVPRSITYIDDGGDIWEFIPPDPVPVLIGNIYRKAADDDLNLSDYDRELMAKLKVKF